MYNVIVDISSVQGNIAYLGRYNLSPAMIFEVVADAYSNNIVFDYDIEHSMLMGLQKYEFSMTNTTSVHMCEILEELQQIYIVMAEALDLHFKGPEDILVRLKKVHHHNLYLSIVDINVL